MSREPADVLFVSSSYTSLNHVAAAALNKAAGEKATVSAATVGECFDMHPAIATLMSESGLKIDDVQPVPLKSVLDKPFDYVITLDDKALHNTPEIHGNPRRIHWPLSTRAKTGMAPGVEAVFTRTLDEIEERVTELCRQIDELPRARELHLAPGASTCFARPDSFSPAEHFPMLAEAGFKCIELNCCLGSWDFMHDVYAPVDELIRVSKETGVCVWSVHAPSHMFEPMGRNPGKYRSHIDLMKYFADLTAALGAHTLVFHTYPVCKPDNVESVAQLQDALLELEEYMVTLPCMLAWENDMGCKHTARQHFDWIRTLNPSAYGFCFDNGHANRDGNSDEYLSLCSMRLISLHMADNHGEYDEHARPGEAGYDWKGYVSKIEAAGYVGPLMLECSDWDGEMTRLVEIEGMKAGNTLTYPYKRPI